MYEYKFDQPDEIDLIGLCKYLIKKWKIFLIAVLAGAALALAYNYHQVSNWQPQMLSDYVDAQITEDVIREFDMDMVNQAVKYHKSLDEFDATYANRVATQMDPSNVYTYSASYLISADNFSIDAAKVYYAEQLQTGEGKNRIKAAIGNDCTDVDFSDLFVVSASTLFRADPTETGEATPATAQIDIHYYSAEESSVSAVADAVDAILRAASQDEAASGEIAFLCRDTAVGYSAVIYSLRNSCVNERNTYLTNITNAEKNLSEEALYYVDYLAGEEYQINETARMHVLKYGVIGAVVFAFLTGVYYVCKFIFSKKIKAIGDIEWLCPGHILAQSPKNTLEYITSAIGALDGQSILISVDRAVKENSALQNAICKADSRVAVVGSLDVDPTAVTKAKNADAIVIMVQLWRTDVDSLQMELAKVQSLGKNFAGFIVIE